jgi:hypothetical protein
MPSPTIGSPSAALLLIGAERAQIVPVQHGKSGTSCFPQSTFKNIRFTSWCKPLKYLNKNPGQRNREKRRGGGKFGTKKSRTQSIENSDRRLTQRIESALEFNKMTESAWLLAALHHNYKI